MPRPSLRPRPRSQRPTALAAVALVCCLVTGCTDDAAEPSSVPKSSAPSGVSASETTPEAEPQVVLVARAGTVAGRIGRGDRNDVVTRVARVVDAWLEAAYVGGDYPRRASSYDGAAAWPGFTAGAARTAAADRDLMSNADIADRVAELTVRKRRVVVDVLAVGRRAQAATARLRLVFTTRGVDGGFARRVTVSGRVFLTKKDGRWKVFGYDVAKARV